jgi:hypothetical protein
MLYVEEERKNEIIANAIDQEMPCVITCRADEGWQTHKSRFIPCPLAVGRLFVEIPDQRRTGQGRDFLTGERLGVSFRRGHKKSMFGTVVLGSESVPVGTGNEIECVELQWPEMLQELQRRAYYRAAPPGRKVHVRFWQGGVGARADLEQQGRQMFHGVLHDLSAGGMRVATADASPDFFVVGEPFGCSFMPKPRGETFVLDATYRHCQPLEDGLVSLGFQFVGLETTARGQVTLAKLAGVVTDYQRAETRQKRGQTAHCDR